MNEVIAVGALTDIGMRRTTNQDAFLAERGVYVVCDGMGGETGGERASAIAVEEFARLAAAGERTRAAIDAAVQRAQRRARALGVELGGIAGTTISGIVLPQWGAGTDPHGAQTGANAAARRACCHAGRRCASSTPRPRAHPPARPRTPHNPPRAPLR